MRISLQLKCTSQLPLARKPIVANRAFRRAFSSTSFRLNDQKNDTPISLEFGVDGKAGNSDPSHKGNLAKIIRDSIKATGPIPVSRYMQLCLGHPTEGYYTRQRQFADVAGGLAERDVFGSKGDFITSPEISQVFGELIAVWLVTQWAAQGKPKRVRIVELGPGRGTLLDDVLRTFLSLPSFPISALQSIHLVETSEPLMAQQEEKLGKRIRTFGGHADYVKLEWWDRVADIPLDPDCFTMVLAHEFFDALPINIFEKTPEGFREIYVNLDSANPPSFSPSAASSSGLTLALARDPTTLSTVLPATSPRYQAMKEGERVEISSDSWQMIRSVGELIVGQREAEETAAAGESSDRTAENLAGGAGLVVDYGLNGLSSNSFRAFRRHEIVHVFDDPGSADLTANVDFAYMKESLSGLALGHGPLAQRDFLMWLGMASRLQKLLDGAPNPERRGEIAQAAMRLVDPKGMGAQYQFLAITPPGVNEVYPFKDVEEALKGGKA